MYFYLNSVCFFGVDYEKKEFKWGFSVDYIFIENKRCSEGGLKKKRQRYNREKRYRGKKIQFVSIEFGIEWRATKNG